MIVNLRNLRVAGRVTGEVLRDQFTRYDFHDTKDRNLHEIDAPMDLIEHHGGQSEIQLSLSWTMTTEKKTYQ